MWNRLTSNDVLGLTFWLLVPMVAQAQEGDSFAVGEEVFANWRVSEHRVAHLWPLAEQAVKAGDQAGAAEILGSIYAQLPPSPQAQKAALRAGICYGEAGDYVQSLECFERVLMIGYGLTTDDYLRYPAKHSKREKLGKRLGTVRSWTEAAVVAKAKLLLRLKRLEEVGNDLDQLALDFPNSPHLLELVESRAALSATGNQPPPDVLEREASVLWQRIEAVPKGAEGDDLILRLTDAMLAQSPGSALAPAAMARRADSLWRSRRYAEARENYEKLLTRARLSAPLARATVTAEHRLAWLDASTTLKRLIGAQRASPVPDAEWDRLRAMLDIVIRSNPELEHRAIAGVMKAEAWCWQGRNREALREAEKVLELQHFRAESPGAQHAWAAAHLYAGIACQRLQFFSDAVYHFSQVTQSAGFNQQPGSHAVLANAQYRLWYALYESTGNSAATIDAAHVMLSQFPDFSDAPRVKRMSLTGAATQPQGVQP